MSARSKAQLRAQIKLLLTHKPMLKMVMRMKNEAGTKPEEIHMPWQPYQLLPSDKTLDDIMSAIEAHEATHVRCTHSHTD